jgi:subtilisin family serine protease
VRGRRKGLLNNNKRFVLSTVGLFVISILVTSSLFFIITSTNGFIQYVNHDEPYYSTQEASAQEGIVDGEPAEAAAKIDISSEQPPQEQQEAPTPTTLTSTECPPGTRPETETATPVQCLPDTSPTEQEDFFFLENETVPVTIGMDEVGVVAKDNITSDQLQEFLSRFQLELIREYPQSIFTFGLPGNLSRPEIVNLSRTIVSEGEQLVADAGFTITPEGAETPFIVTDELIAEFKPGTDYEQIASFNNDSGVEIVTPGPLKDNQFILEVTQAAPVDTLETANRYQESNLTVFAQPNFVTVLDFREFIPNDSLFGNQWHHNNSGLEGGTVDADVDSSLAWDVTQGSADTIIAVIDDGFDMSHPDLAQNLWVNAGEVPGNGVDDDGNSFIDDMHGFDFRGNDGNPAASINDYHGTLTAGVTAALGNNALGVAGICPNCSLMLIRQGTYIQNHTSAIEYAWRMGADIITNSWGYRIGTPATTSVVDAINNATTLGRGGLGTVVLFGMNNVNRNDCADTAPATRPDISSLPNVIAVSASSNQDRKVTESAWGSCMDVLAPADRGSGPNPIGRPPGSGVPYTGTLNIATTDRTGSTGFNNATTWNRLQGVDPTYCPVEAANPDYTLCYGGTSSATPLTAGIAGLILTVNPGLTRLQVQQLLQDSADKIEDSNGRYATNNGFSTPAIGVATHGWGRINSFEALRIATPPEQGGLGGVDILLRDNRLDWGNTEQPSNVLFESDRGFIGHWLSQDIKVDAPPYQPSPVKGADFESLIDETPSAVSGDVNRVYVRVHNRGPVTDESVTVKLHWAQFGTALPALPSDFWTAFPADSNDAMQWHPLNCAGTSSSACPITDLAYSGSSVATTTADAAQIVAFDFPTPPVITDLSNHFSLLAMINSAQDPISPMSRATFVVDDITPRDNNLSYRNYMNLSTSRDRNFTEGLFVRNPTDEPIQAFLRLEAPEDWIIELDKFDFNEVFTLEPNQEVPVSINIILPELNQQGEVNIIQERIENQNSIVMGGLSYQFSAAQ